MVRGRIFPKSPSAVIGVTILLVLIIYPLLTFLAQILFPNLFAVRISFQPTLKPLFSASTDKLNLESLVNSLSTGIVGALRVSCPIRDSLVSRDGIYRWIAAVLHPTPIGSHEPIVTGLLTAAQLFGARQPRIVLRIVLPLVSSTVVSTFFMTFTHTVFELSASMMLYPAGMPTFSVKAEEQFSAFNWASGSAITMIGIAIVFADYLLGNQLSTQIERRPHVSDSQVKETNEEMTEKPATVALS